MKIRLLLLLCLGLPLFAQAQHTEDEAAISSLIQTLFDGMRAGDTSVMSPHFLPGAKLQSVFINPQGETVIRGGSAAGWLGSVGTPHEQVYDEKIWSMDILVDGPLANAWTDYTFFLGDQMSHCGVNAFQLVKKDGRWMVYQVTDTRRKEGCITEAAQPSKAIHAFLDSWHEAAATADADAYFGGMTEDAIFLGTDASERWLRDELRDWAKGAFERESAWAFTSSERELYFTSDQKTAWFEEKLATGMGPCRGSGVVQWIDGEWRIKHYNLALLVPNDKLDDLKKLLEEGGK